MSEETRNNRDADMRELMVRVNRLDELKAAVEKTEGAAMSEERFAKRFLSFSSTTWSKVKSGTYAGNLASVAAKCTSAIESIEAQLPSIEGAAKYSQEFVRTQLAKAAFAAINKARAGVESRRVVAVLAPTGGGKTALAKYLKGKGAVCVEGRQAWRTSYKAFCSDVARAVGRNVPSSWQEYRVEEEMVKALSARDGVLFIDEANTMSAACANAVKYIVNRTGYTVVIAAIPSLWDKFLSSNRDEVLQLVNRCQPVIRAERVSEADVSQFLAARGLPAKGRFSRDIAAAANAFGGFRTVVSIVNRLAEIGEPSEDDLAAELKAAAAEIVASGIGK